MYFSVSVCTSLYQRVLLCICVFFIVFVCICIIRGMCLFSQSAGEAAFNFLHLEILLDKRGLCVWPGSIPNYSHTGHITCVRVLMYSRVLVCCEAVYL